MHLCLWGCIAKLYYVIFEKNCLLTAGTSTMQNAEKRWRATSTSKNVLLFFLFLYTIWREESTTMSLLLHIFLFSAHYFVCAMQSVLFAAAATAATLASSIQLTTHRIYLVDLYIEWSHIDKINGKKQIFFRSFSFLGSKSQTQAHEKLGALLAIYTSALWIQFWIVYFLLSVFLHHLFIINNSESAQFPIPWTLLAVVTAVAAASCD